MFISWMSRSIKALRYSYQGLKSSVKTEVSFQLEVILILILTPCAIILAHSFKDVLYLLGPFIFVLSLELINTAIENIINEVGQGRIRHRFRVAKDCGSAAVFLTLLWGMITWVIYIAEC